LSTSFLADSKRVVVLIIASIAAFMGPLDGSIVNVALPSIARSLNAGLSYLILVPTIYLIVLASLQTTFGRLADVKGRVRVFNIGVGVFTAASLLAGLSQDILQLILFRVIQGVGAAIMGATATALVAEAYPPSRRGAAIGVNTMAVYAGLTLGPVLGGFLVQVFGWRSIFLVNIPIGFATLFLSAYWLRGLGVKVMRRGFDLVGSATLTTFLVTLLLILSQGDLQFTSAQLTALSTLCVLSLSAFVYSERRVSEPLMDLRLFTSNRLFSAGNITALLNYSTTAGTVLLISIHLQFILGFSPSEAGLILLSQPLVMVVVAPIAGWLSDRIDARVLSSIGMTIRTAGLLLLALYSEALSRSFIIAPLLILGLGNGLFSSPNVNSILSSVPKEKYGLASGILSTIRTMGQSIGIAILGSVVSMAMPPGTFARLGEDADELAAFFLGGVKMAFLTASILSGLGIFTSLIRGSEHKQRASVEVRM
jgi:EmrB/QacA subfamily drug resistance transporter